MYKKDNYLKLTDIYDEVYLNSDVLKSAKQSKPGFNQGKEYVKIISIIKNNTSPIKMTNLSFINGPQLAVPYQYSNFFGSNRVNHQIDMISESSVRKQHYFSHQNPKYDCRIDQVKQARLDNSISQSILFDGHVKKGLELTRKKQQIKNNSNALIQPLTSQVKNQPKSQCQFQYLQQIAQQRRALKTKIFIK